MGPSLNPEREKLTALRLGESVVLPWPENRTRQTYFRSISVMACRLRQLGVLVVVNRTEQGMRAERVLTARQNGRKHGETWEQLLAMEKQQVLAVPSDDGMTGYWRIAAIRDRLQKQTGRVYRINQTPEGVRVERRA